MSLPPAPRPPDSRGHRASARGTETELLRIGFAPPGRGFPGWHREGVGVEVFDHPRKRYFEVIVWLIGNAVTPHVIVSERDNPSVQWVRDTIRRAEKKRRRPDAPRPFHESLDEEDFAVIREDQRA